MFKFKEYRHVVFQRDVFSVLIHTDSKSVASKQEGFGKRYLSQCMIGVQEDDMLSLLSRTSPEGVITRGYFLKNLKNMIPLVGVKYTPMPELLKIPRVPIFLFLRHLLEMVI